MPDISKLPELAALFGTTIDELLGRRCPVLEQAAAGRFDEHLRTAGVTPQEAAEAAPFLPPEQAAALAAQAIDSAPQDEPIDISALLPFMSTAQVDKLLQKRLATNDYAMLLPFCSTAAIDEAAQAQIEAGQGIAAFMPFLSSAALKAAWDTRIARGESTAEFLPFMPTETIDHLALERSERGEGFAALLPFLSSGTLMHIFRQRVEQKQSVHMLLPFLPSSAIDHLANSFTDE